MDYAISTDRRGHSRERLLKKQGSELSNKLEARAVEHRSPSHMNIFQSSPWSSNLLLETCSSSDAMIHSLTSANLCANGSFSRSPILYKQCKLSVFPPNSTSACLIPPTVSYFSFFFFYLTLNTFYSTI